MFSDDPMSIINLETGVDLSHSDGNSKDPISIINNNPYIIISSYTMNDVIINKSFKYIKSKHGFERILKDTCLYF